MCQSRLTFRVRVRVRVRTRFRVKVRVRIFLAYFLSRNSFPMRKIDEKFKKMRHLQSSWKNNYYFCVSLASLFIILCQSRLTFRVRIRVRVDVRIRIFLAYFLIQKLISMRKIDKKFKKMHQLQSGWKNNYYFCVILPHFLLFLCQSRLTF